MRPSLWKKWLSYITEFHIEDAPSDLNPQLHVCLVNGRYQLCTENAIYSYADLYDNFSGAFAQLNLKDRDIKKVLILGFGMASIPIILEKMGLKYAYTAVEIDEQVIYLASKYELPYLKAPVQMICADAEHWVQMTTEQFDMIAVDIFLDDVIPDRFTQSTFLENTKNLLRPGGLLLYNRLANTEADLEKTKLFYGETFKEVFPNGKYLSVGGNWMLVNE